MTALAADRKADQLGTAIEVIPTLLRYPVEASAAIYGGALVAINAAGNAVPVSANSALKCVGRAERQTINLAQSAGGTTSPDGIATGVAGSISVPVHTGAFYFNINADSAITKANFGANVFASDDNTVSLSDAGGTRPYAGWIIDAPISSTLANMGTNGALVGVMVGQPNPYAMNPLLSNVGQWKARCVVTSLQAYTGTGTGTLTETANGAWAGQDGVTNAVGDIVFIQGGTTNLVGALDSGPWQISNLGGASAKWALTRPDWFANGSALGNATVLDIGSEGAIWADTQWKPFAAPTAVIGTTDPAFYVGRMIQQVTLVAGTIAIANVGIRSATKSAVVATRAAAGGTVTATVGYGTLAAMTPGYIGTASAAVTAYIANMTIQNADTSNLNVIVQNW